MTNRPDEVVLCLAVNGDQCGFLVFAPPLSFVVILSFRIDSVALALEAEGTSWTQHGVHGDTLIAAVTKLGLRLARSIPAVELSVPSTIE